MALSICRELDVTRILAYQYGIFRGRLRHALGYISGDASCMEISDPYSSFNAKAQ